MNENEEQPPQPSLPDTQATPDTTPLPEKPAMESSPAAPSADAPASQAVPQAVAFPTPDPAFILQRNQDVEQEMHQISRRSFLWTAATVATGFVGWRWLTTRRDEDGVLWPLRSALNLNEQLARDYFRGSRLASTFPRAMAQTPRANGDYGLSDDFDPTTWKLQVIGLADTTQASMMRMPPPPMPTPSPKDMLTPPELPPSDKKATDKKAPAAHRPADKKAPAVQNDTDDTQTADNNSGDSGQAMTTQEPVVQLTLDDIKALPRVEMVTELKCIEGWSTVVQWAGARFADFVKKYPPAPADDGKLPEYVAMETPDGEYYVGLDMDSAMHPQTLLCYEMNGQPLTLDHGAPLRLVIPVKYGIKNIKCIGTIRFTSERPKDYWATLGYDWYAGH